MSTSGIQVKYDPTTQHFVSCWSAPSPKSEELPRQWLRETHRVTYALEDESSMGNYVSTRLDNG